MNRIRPIVLVVVCLSVALGPDAAGSKGDSALRDRIKKYGPVGVSHNEARQKARSSLDGASAVGGGDAASATTITSNPYVDSDDTTGKGNNALLPSCTSGGSDTAEDAWYKLVLTGSSTVDLWTTCESGGGTSYDTRIGVFDSALVLIACNDDAPDCGAPYYQSGISGLALLPGTYYLVVDGYGGNVGPYEFNVSWLEAAGACEGGSDYTNADSIALPFSGGGTTAGACNNIMIDCELGGGGTAPDYWYTVAVDTMVLMDVSTTCDTSGIDTRIAILDSTLNQMYCNDDDPLCAEGGKSYIEYAFLEAGVYFIVVEGADTTRGSYTLNVDTVHTDVASGLLEPPDIIVRESDLYDHDFSTSIIPGRTHLRLSNGTANVGTGKFYVYGTGVDNGDGTENIMQRVWRSNGTTFDRTSGVFIFHQAHNHIHIEEWCNYSLHEVLPNDGVGAEVAKGSKTSFCILDLAVYDAGLPNHNPIAEFTTCGSTIQGLSVGWVDVYSKNLAGQNIDITDVPDGTYWLQSTADPNDFFLESDETNNYARIKVVIGSGPQINPDLFEPNDTTTVVDARPPGGPNSPNLGPANPLLVLSGLTVHVSGNDDYYKFYSSGTGASGDFVSISFDTAQGHLDLYLLDSNGVVVDSSTTVDTIETITLDGRAGGWYYVGVRGTGGDLSPAYTLTVDPPVNGTPVVDVINPPLGTNYLVQGQDTYVVTWTTSDPESNLTWVSLWANTSPGFDGNEIFLPTSLNTSGEQGFYIINSAYLGFDTYWIYAEVTDGGSKSGEWSDGTIKLLDATTGVDGTPRRLTRLYAAAPNPFGSRATLRLDLEVASVVTWRVYDVGGRLVREIFSGPLTGGSHFRAWDGRNRFGQLAPTGVYFQRVVGADVHLTNKVMLIR